MKRSGLAPVVLLALAAACGPSGGRSASPAPASPQASSPAATPAQVTSCASGFAAAEATGGSAAGGRVVTVRAASSAGYDRFVIEFEGAVPRFVVRRQGPMFVLSPKGESVTLDGSAGVLVRLEPALDWTSYTGPSDLHPGYQFIREARLLENFEAVHQWGLGVSSPACLRVSTLESPSRLVVDVSAAR